MESRGSKYKELSEQMGTWWRTQKDYTTKAALAGFLKVHRDTIGDYFFGRKFPRPDIAVRLYKLTNADCLRPAPAASSSKTVAPSTALAIPPAAITAAAEEERRPVRRGSVEEPVPEEVPETPPPPGERLKKGQRYQEKTMIISLQRTTCPFCAHDITKYANCLYCQQHFVWACLPVAPNV